mgnify:FL=1
MNRSKLKKDTCGAISLMLALLIVPFYSVAGILVEMSRYKSALSGLDDAVNTSAMAVLAQYDQFLMNRFGLFAIGQSESNSFDNGFTGQKSIQKQFSNYLKAQDTTDTRSFDLTSIQAEGVYPLADLDILESQINAYASSAVPTMLVSDFGATGLQDLIGNLQNNLPLLGYVKAAGSSAKAAGKTMDYLDALDNAKSSVKSLSEKDDKYNIAHSDYDTALSEYLEILNQRPSLDADQDTIDAYQEKYDAALKKANDAQKQYKKSLQDEIDGTEKLGKNLVDATKKKNEEKDAYKTVGKDLTYAIADDNLSKTEEVKRDDAGNSIKDEHGNAVTEKKSQTLNKQIEEKKKLLESGKLSEYEKQKTQAELDALKKTKNEMSTAKKTVDGIASGTDSSQTNKILEKFNTETCDEAMSGLIKEMDTLRDTDLSKMDAGEIMKLQQSLHKTDMSQLTDYNQFDSLLKEAMDASKSTDKNISFWSELAKTLSTFMDLSITYDPKLQSEIDMQYYTDNFNGLPGDKDRSNSAYSLESPYEKQDSILAQANKTKIQATDIFSDMLFPRSASGAVASLGSTSNKAGNAKTTVGKMIKMVESIMKTVTQAVSFVSNISKLTMSTAGDAILLPAYMRYMTTNRTEYASMTALTGTNIKGAGGLAEEVGKSQYNLAAWFQAKPETNYSFCGAETEYLIIGDTSEKENQTKIFYYMLVLRMLTDFYPVTSNSEVKALCDGAAAVLSAVIPYEASCIILQSLAIILEAYFDTVLICNGSDSIQFIKGTKDIFLCAEGIPKLIGSVQRLATVSDDNKKLIADKLGKLEEKGDIRAAFTTGGESRGDYLGSTNGIGIKIDYPSYLLIMMMIENDQLLLKRFSNLIQMEETQRNLVNNASAAQKMSGRYPKFDLDKAYTTLRTEVKGNFVSVLPVPTLSQKSIWKADRVIYRGY